MLDITLLNNDQKEMIKHILINKKTHNWQDMGFGKTVTTLSAYNSLLILGEVKRVLVISYPSIVFNVWEQETKKWKHLQDLTFTKIKGNPKQRKELVTYARDTDFTLLSIFNLDWFIKEYKNNWIWDALIIDESTLFKSYKAVRFKALKEVLDNFKYITLLSGTPKPNSYQDLWSQYFILDKGERLGKNITAFRNNFMEQGYFKYSWELKPKADKEIKEKIKDITFYKDVKISLPQIFYKYEEIELPSKIIKILNTAKSEAILNIYNIDEVRELKKKFDKEEDFIKQMQIQIKIDELLEDSLSLNSAVSIYNKLLQISSSGYYDEDKKYIHVHDTKIKYLKDFLEYHNENFIIVYNFQFEKDLILKNIKNVVAFDKRKSEKIISDWNNRKIKYLLTHAGSLSHGVNLQFGGNSLIWYSPTSNLEQYLQMNKRLHRKGQTKNVNIIHFYTSIFEKTVYDNLNNKNMSQKDLLKSMNKLLISDI